jgi:aspartyl-tRNA synthetase
MLISGTSNIREVIAFPKNSRGYDLMMSAPSEVPDKQLRELHIQNRKTAGISHGT